MPYTDHRPFMRSNYFADDPKDGDVKILKGFDSLKIFDNHFSSPLEPPTAGREELAIRFVPNFDVRDEYSGPVVPLNRTVRIGSQQTSRIESAWSRILRG